MMNEDVKMMRVADVLPSGQTGFDLSREERKIVRLFYRANRENVSLPREESRAVASRLASQYDRSEYSDSRRVAHRDSMERVLRDCVAKNVVPSDELLCCFVGRENYSCRKVASVVVIEERADGTRVAMPGCSSCAEVFRVRPDAYLVVAFDAIRHELGRDCFDNSHAADIRKVSPCENGTDEIECAMVRERSVAGTDAPIPDCSFHGAFRFYPECMELTCDNAGETHDYGSEDCSYNYVNGDVIRKGEK